MKILLVDDEMFTIRMLQNLIHWEQLGLEVMGYARDGQEAFHMIMENPPDIVLTDIKMDTMNGLELVKKIQGYSPDIRVLLISAYADFGYVKEAMKRGCSDYILKPIDEAELEQALRRTVEEIRGRKEQESVINESEAQLRAMKLYQYMKNGRSLNSILNFEQYLPVDFNSYSLMMVRLENETIDEFNSISTMAPVQSGYLTGLMKEILSEKTEHFLIFDYEAQNWFLLLEGLNGRDKAACAQRILEMLKRELDVRGFICFSARQQGLDKLPMVYEEVTALGKYGFFVGEEPILGYDYNCSQKEMEEIRTIGAMREQEQKDTDMASGQGKRYSKPVELSLQLIEGSYDRNISLDEICREAAVSRNYFCYLFKREVGVSVWNYLTQLRMERAKKLLEETDLRSYEIAFQVGYDNPSYFSRIFKKYEQMTPNEYRENRK